MRYDMLRNYCHEIDKLYNVEDKSIICVDDSDKFIIICNLEAFKTTIYIPFYYKNIPIKLYDNSIL